MRAALAIVAVAALLGGCVGGGGVVSAGHAICARQDSARAGLLVALARAEGIADPVRREAALGAVRTSLAALDRCPAVSGD